MSEKKTPPKRRKKKTTSTCIYDVPQLVAIKELEKELGTPPDFFEALLAEDDWSFIIKLHSLIEAAIAHLLTTTLGKSELLEIMTRLELSNFASGKLAFVKSLELLDSDSRRFIQKLSELRNKFVHNVANVGITLESYFSNLSAADAKGYTTAFNWGYTSEKQAKAKVGDDLYDLHEVIKQAAIVTSKHSHKIAIWMGTIIILRRTCAKIAEKKFEEDLRQVNEQIISLIDSLNPHRGRGTNEDDAPRIDNEQ